MKQSDCTFIEANQLRFAADCVGEGERVALFLHGFPESRRCWRQQLPLVAGLGWRAVAVDMRGYGQSSRPKGRAAYRMGRLVEDVAALFHALGARERLLVGHDWGGMVAWSAAIRRACPLDGLVIINAPHPLVFRDVMRSSWRQRLRSWYIAFFALPWLPEKYLTAGHARAVAAALERTASRADVFPPDILAHYRDNAARPGAMTAMLDYYRANPDLRRLGAGAGVDVPTLLLWGDRDSALGTELVAGTAEHVPDLSIEILHGVSHWVPEEAPDRVNAALAEWLGRLRAAPSNS
jgi:pimeloyl-ACP methyl ester carboxylesterase